MWEHGFEAFLTRGYVCWDRLKPALKKLPRFVCYVEENLVRFALNLLRFAPQNLQCCSRGPQGEANWVYGKFKRLRCASDPSDRA